MRNLHSYSSLIEWVSEQRNSGNSIGFTCGAFDLLHAGHVAYLQKAATLCSRLVVAVNSDASIRSYKNPLRPIIPEQQRATVVSALGVTDAVTIMTETRPENLIKMIHPDVYVKGGDYRVEQLQSAPLVHSYGGRCVVIPVEHEISTSRIVSKIQELSAYDLPSLSAQLRSNGSIVFLDRDGTLIENVPFLRDPTQVRLLPYVGEGLRLLQDSGFALVVVTNQQGIGLGYFDYDDFVRINSEMLRLLSRFGVRIARFYFCPHSAADSCQCRKPLPGLLKRGLDYFGSDPQNCFMIGDSASDVAAAEEAGCRGVLLSPAQDGRTLKGAITGFKDAVDLILNSITTTKAK